MAYKRSIQSLALSASARLSQRTTPRASLSSTLAVRQYITFHNAPHPVASRCHPKHQIRKHSEAASSKSKVYDYEEIKSLSSSPSSDQILIDVREPSEYKAGFIPTAINIPITSQPDAFFLSPDDFEDRFGLQKPPADKELVFYCKAGVRSSAAAQLAQQQGYERVGEYRGSWIDWMKRGGGT